jgi:hypothetical protein
VTSSHVPDRLGEDLDATKRLRLTQARTVGDVHLLVYERAG